MIDIPQDVHTPSIWVSTIVRSYHADRVSKYNERNFGIEAEASFKGNLKFLTGEYRNSFNRHSNYIGVAWLPYSPKWNDNIHMGLGAAGVTGYKYSIAILPIITYENIKYHFGINVLPGIIVNAIQFKIGF